MAIEWNTYNAFPYYWAEKPAFLTDFVKIEPDDVIEQKPLYGPDDSATHIILETYDGFRKVAYTSSHTNYMYPHSQYMINGEVVVFRQISPYLFKQDPPHHKNNYK